MSAGFGEQGPDGIRRQELLVELDRRCGVRLIGPNCLGFARPDAGVQAFFGPSTALPGRLALLSQSGAVCTGVVDWAAQREVGFSAVASLGAAADVGFGDVLDDLAVDVQTDAIVLYVEGVDHPRLAMLPPSVVRELDINPLVADERGVVAVDVRVALHTPPRALARYDHLAIAPYPSEFSADGKVGEFALVVADAWQGRGVGPHSCTRSRTALEHKACSASMARFSP